MADAGGMKANIRFADLLSAVFPFPERQTANFLLCENFFTLPLAFAKELCYDNAVKSITTHRSGQDPRRLPAEGTLENLIPRMSAEGARS